MNDKPRDEVDLPELSDHAVERIESAVFAEIESERPSAHRSTDRAHARRRRWTTGIGIAAAFVVGVLVTPPILGAVGGSAMGTADGGGAPIGVAEDASGAPPVGMTDLSPESIEEAAPSASDTVREIVSTASATVQVKDVAKAADQIAALASEHGGYVESTEVGKDLAVEPTSTTPPADPGFGWISVRVPSADLTVVIDALGETGDVLSSSLSTQDVTATAIDLRARVDATKASVQRLTELMSQAGSVSDLIDAEVALTDRQAQLESYEQQLKALDEQVAMSSLHVQLTRPAPQASADPAGFGDGLAAGWNGLIVSLNALVIALGFILPWLAVAAVVVLVIWLVRRGRRRRRRVASVTWAGDADS